MQLILTYLSRYSHSFGLNSAVEVAGLESLTTRLMKLDL